MTPAFENRRGCLIMVVILAALLALLAYIGFSSEPGNEAQEDIPTAPVGG